MKKLKKAEVKETKVLNTDEETEEDALQVLQVILEGHYLSRLCPLCTLRKACRFHNWLTSGHEQ
jgi:hypothetical protein